MRNFVATVKKRQHDQPCFLLIELHEDIGLDDNQNIVFDMPTGTNYEDTKRLARQLNDMDVRVAVKRF